jgi:hypothetical protein
LSRQKLEWLASFIIVNASAPVSPESGEVCVRAKLVPRRGTVGNIIGKHPFRRCGLPPFRQHCAMAHSAYANTICLQQRRIFVFVAGEFQVYRQNDKDVANSANLLVV